MVPEGGLPRSNHGIDYLDQYTSSGSPGTRKGQVMTYRHTRPGTITMFTSLVCGPVH
jgi:hypothetical protein